MALFGIRGIDGIDGDHCGGRGFGELSRIDPRGGERIRLCLLCNGTLGWFILGFLFFAVLYAAAGSMVSRQEDVNATAMPLALLVMAMVSVAFVSVSNPEGTLSNVLSWIPPFSAILMPLRISAGVASPFQIVGTILLMLVVTAALSMIAAKIYQRSILRIGKVVSWKEAFGR